MPSKRAHKAHGTYTRAQQDKEQEERKQKTLFPLTCNLTNQQNPS